MRLAVLFAVAFAALGCTTKTGNEWVKELPEDAPGQESLARAGGLPDDDAPLPPAAEGEAAPLPPAVEDSPVVGNGERLTIRDDDGTPRAVIQAPDERDAPFRNTYYDFPREGAGAKDASLFGPACGVIARVTREFHDQVCVQGSGRLASGETVGFAKRACACAAVCPRTGQQICFEKLDPALFPSGRGASGQPITPLRTVAVDTSVIPLGTLLFIPELMGLARPDGSLHDGCFLAEDRGIRVVGRQVDIFTGDPAVTARWNALVPSNRGVHIRLNDPRCAAH